MTKEIITFSSAMNALGLYYYEAQFPIYAKTHINLGLGGFYFTYKRFAREEDYICGFRVNGEYRRNKFPLKNKINCEINVLIEPLDKHPDIVTIKDKQQHNYHLQYTATTNVDLYHQDIEDCCNKLVGEIMFEHFGTRDSEYKKDNELFRKIEDDNTTIFMGRTTYWNESLLSHGYTHLLNADEYLLNQR